MKIIGLTGGIASGKSTVSRCLQELGAVIIDADVIARQIVEPGQPAYREIVEHFGPGILHPDGSINREHLGSIVFARAEERARLNAITHPRVREAIDEQLEKCREQGVAVAVLDVPLLYETGMDDLADEVWVVWVPYMVQIERLMARDRIDESAARARIASQIPLEEKKARAQVVVDNSGDREDTCRQVSIFYNHLRAPDHDTIK